MSGRFDPRSSWPAFLATAGLGLALALTALDPGPSRGLGVAQRLAFWLAHCLIPIVLLEAVQIALGRVRAIDRASPWAKVAFAGLVGAVVFAPVALLLDQAFPLPPEMADASGLAAELIGEFAAFAPPMLIVWVGLNAPRLLSLGASGPDAAAPTGSDVQTLWSRTPRRIGRDLVSLSAELHYLRVVTTAGEALILQSFGRALELPETASGVRIHRSHWVALRHLEAVRREGDRVTARLSDGRELPVSRAYRPAVRAAIAEAVRTDGDAKGSKRIG